MKKLSALCFAALALGAAACSAGAEDDSVMSAMGDTDESEAALSVAGGAVVGSYVQGGSGLAGNLDALVLKSDGKFFADFANTIRCVRAPCPSNAERVEGTFTAGAKTVTLRSPGASARAQAYLGRFYYTKAQDTLTLKKGANEYVLGIATSYCAQADDCWGQAMITPACFPLSFTCGAQNTCGFHCGSPPPLDPCGGLDQQACLAKPSLCQPKFGPSACSPPPHAVCTADMAYKGCEKR